MFKFKRKPFSVASLIAWKLVLLTIFTLSIVHLLGIVPNPKQAQLKRKAIITESLAITSSLLAQNNENEILKKNLSSILERHPDVLSACIRRSDGTVLHKIGDHQKFWVLPPNAPSTPDNICVPVTNGEQKWGTVELSFQQQRGLIAHLFQSPLLLLGIFTVCINGFLFRWYLTRAFKYLDPSKSVPTHVRATLDTFSEGVVVLDNDQQIVLANDKFKKHIGKGEEDLLGQDINLLPWNDSDGAPLQLQWEDESSLEGMRLGLKLEQGDRTYLVNSSPILGDDGQRRGTIASFDDITPLEENRKELSNMLVELKSSRDELKIRNKELKHLATRDPLTNCLNRRSFFEIFDKQWKLAHRHQQPLSCCMFDIDHFKSVNDNYGHSVGDEVLQQIAAVIENCVRDSDVVCRYGGEEFCILLPKTDLTLACETVERLRSVIEQIQFDSFSVTASLGVASIGFGAGDPQQLLDQADKSLYAAKRTGRNQVIRWDKIPAEAGVERPQQEQPESTLSDTEYEVSIPYPAVAALLSALSYRDVTTATHSTRVAELCVATASGLLSVADTYVLEVAALLHDIGKIGVPDAVLLKPGPLTRDEWEMMGLYDRIGVEIVEASFSNPQLVNIMRYHHVNYGGSEAATHQPHGRDIPIGARIVAIADAYDSMISDHVYRKGRPKKEAFQELRRCAGTQFDPELVERFIRTAKNHNPINFPVESRQTALQIGMQIERLAEAIDERDSTGIKALAARLEATAARGGIPEIESVACDIKQTTSENCDLVSLLQMVDQLMSLCRSAQKIHTCPSINNGSSRNVVTQEMSRDA